MRRQERDLSRIQGRCGRDPSGLPWKPQQFPADADILKKMVVDACINIGVPETLNKSLVEIRDLLSRFIVYREDDPSSIFPRVCPACAIIIARGFCYCTACECEFISTGKFVIHVDDDEPKPSDTTNVTEEVKQARKMLSDPKKNDPTPMR